MIMLIRQRLLIITPPKCGSTSAHDRWCQPDVGGIFVIGPQLDGRIDKHTTAIPWDAQKFRRVVLIRDPFSRAVSLWSHARSFHAPSIRIDDFLEQLPRRQNPFETPLCEIAGIDPDYERWPIESIDAIAERHGLPALPISNRTEKSPSLSDAQRKKLMPWAAGDMQLHPLYR